MTVQDEKKAWGDSKKHHQTPDRKGVKIMTVPFFEREKIAAWRKKERAKQKQGFGEKNNVGGRGVQRIPRAERKKRGKRNKEGVGLSKYKVEWLFK